MELHIKELYFIDTFPNVYLANAYIYAQVILFYILNPAHLETRSKQQCILKDEEGQATVHIKNNGKQATVYAGQD